ncbi:MAG: hypothetical protein NC184_06775 [Roseburia sp.]|nr:hypothetical protein [Roseburia sp.]
MKKLAAVFAAVMTAVSVWYLCACSTDGMENVSERRSAYYSASDGELTVTAVSGVRETPYTLDGRAGELKPFTLITVVPTVFDVDAVYTYRAVTSAGEYSGVLAVHPFAASFSAEFDAETTDDAFTVIVSCGDKTTEYRPTSLVTADMLSCDRAIDAAIGELEPSGTYEIRARLIKNPLEPSTGICWHISIYTESGEDSGVLLDPVTAKVIAKKQA